jgi:hypothetical protein
MSASSRMTSLNPFLQNQEVSSGRDTQIELLFRAGATRAREQRATIEKTAHENNTLVMAKLLICSRTTSIPRSSEALSSRMCFR